MMMEWWRQAAEMVARTEAEGYIWNHKQEAGSKLGKGVRLSKPGSRDILLPSRPHLLSLPKQQHPLGTKHPNA
jgi:hypothetical protein